MERELYRRVRKVPHSLLVRDLTIAGSHAKLSEKSSLLDPPVLGFVKESSIVCARGTRTIHMLTDLFYCKTREKNTHVVVPLKVGDLLNDVH